MKDNDFIRLVREKNIGEEFYSFLDEHDINYVIDLLLELNSIKRYLIIL